MKRILVILTVMIMVGAGAYEAFPGSSTKKSARKAPASPPTPAMSHDCASCHTLSKEDAGAILKDLGTVKDVKMSPVKGLYEVTMQHDNRQAVLYLDFGKKLVAPGPVFDIAQKRSITPPPVELPKILSKAELEKLTATNSIVMGNPSGKKRLFVFTDPDCPFCSRLHGELKKLITMEPDLAIYVKMFPLKMHPEAYGKARVILGANTLEMLDKAFAGQKLPEPGEKDPKEPVDETIKLGESLGINGTPAVIFPDGRVIAGFKDVYSLRSLMSENETAR